MRETIRASAYAGLVDLVGSLGGDIGRIAAKAGLRLPRFERPDDFISSRNLNLLLNAAAITLDRPDLGLMWGARTSLDALGPLSVAIMNSDTARDAVDLAALYLHVHSPVWEVARTPLPKSPNDLISLRCLMKNPPPLMQMCERKTVALHRVLAAICPKSYQPAEVWFHHARLSPLRTYTAIFGIPPEFGRQQTGIVVDRKTLSEFLPGRSRMMLEMARTYLASQSEPQGVSLAHEVGSMVRIFIESEDCSASQIARAMNLHERTLQRRLHAEQISFEQIKDDVRRDLAVEYLGDADIPMSSIAFRLHYKNQSALTRSCKRWFGLSPRQVRQKLLDGRSIGRNGS